MNGWAMMGLIFFAAGLLLIFEIVRPFHDLQIDGPLAAACWTLGLACAGLGLYLQKGKGILLFVSLGLNALALIALLILLILTGSIKKLF